MYQPNAKRVPSCAMCGATLRNRGWFCSYRCDTAELKQRFDSNKVLFEVSQGRVKCTVCGEWAEREEFTSEGNHAHTPAMEPAAS